MTKILALCSVISLLTLVGCAKNETTASNDPAVAKGSPAVSPAPASPDSGNKSGTEDSDSGKTEVTEAELGTSFYPGSKNDLFMNIREKTDKYSTFSSQRTTPDTPQQIVDFYKAQLPKSGFSAPEVPLLDAKTAAMQSKKGESETINVTVTIDDDRKVSMIQVTHRIGTGS